MERIIRTVTNPIYNGVIIFVPLFDPEAQMLAVDAATNVQPSAPILSSDSS